MAPKIVVKQDSIGLVIARFLCVVSFRFFLGRPMNGKKKDNSSFLKGATKGSPSKALTSWQKKPQFHRALIRGTVFWPLALLISLEIWRPRIALLVLVFSLPILGILTARKGRAVFFQPFTTTDASSGVRMQHWIMRPKWRRLFRRQPMPGVLTKKERLNPDLPPEVERAVRETINAQELKGQMPVTKVRRMVKK